jgi:type IV pilus assembly protein PilO
MNLKDLHFKNMPRMARVIVLAIVAGALCGAFYNFVLLKPIGQCKTLQADVDKLQASVSQAKAIESQLQQFKTELAQLELRLEELRKILPPEKETPIVLRSIQQMASASNLKILKFTPQPLKAHDFYVDWPIQIQVEGNYNGLGYFFEKISRYARIINADNIAIKGIDKSADRARTLSASCTATTFVFQEEQAVPPPTDGKKPAVRTKASTKTAAH